MSGVRGGQRRETENRDDPANVRVGREPRPAPDHSGCSGGDGDGHARQGMILPVIRDQRVGKVVGVEDAQQRQEHQRIVDHAERDRRPNPPPSENANSHERNQQQTGHGGMRGRGRVHPASVHRRQTHRQQRLAEVEPK